MSGHKSYAQWMSVIELYFGELFQTWQYRVAV